MFELALKYETSVYSLDIIRASSDINWINYCVLPMSWLSLKGLFP